MCLRRPRLRRIFAKVQCRARRPTRYGAAARADAQGLAYASPEALCELPEAEKHVLDELNKIGKAGRLGANEALAAVRLHAGTGEPTRGPDVPPQFHDPWTPQNGALTATNKINRKPIEKFFAKQVKALAAKGIR